MAEAFVKTYLFSGSDEFRKHLALERLRNKLLGTEKPSPFNYELYYGGETNIGDVITSLDTPSLNGKEKLVVLNGPEFLAEQEKEELIKYLKNQRKRNAILVFLSKELPQQGDRLSTAISQYARVVNFKKVTPNEMLQWVLKEVKARNKTIGRYAAELICESANGDLNKAFAMIEQLSLFTGQRERIRDEDAMVFFEESSEGTTFKLLDAISCRDTMRSLIILTKLLRSEANPSQIIGLLSWHITRLITTKKMLINRISKSDIAGLFNIGGNILGRLLSQADNFTLRQLKRQLAILLDTDILIKSQNINSNILLEILIVRLSTS